MKIDIYTDGGSRGNPGPGGIGVVAVALDRSANRQLYTHSEFIGHSTNNEAEYRAFIVSVGWLTKFIKSVSQPIDQVTWHLDSKLVVEQLNKRWKVKDSSIKKLVAEANTALSQLAPLTAIGSFKYFIKHIPREKNAKADELVNRALDLHA